MRAPGPEGPDGPQASPPPRRLGVGAERLPEPDERDGAAEDLGRLTDGAALGAWRDVDGAGREACGREDEGADREACGREAEGEGRETCGREDEGAGRETCGRADDGADRETCGREDVGADLETSGRDGAARADGAATRGAATEGADRLGLSTDPPRTAGALGRAAGGAERPSVEGLAEGDREGAEGLAGEADARPPLRGETRSDGRRGGATPALPRSAVGDRGTAAPLPPRAAPARGATTSGRAGEPAEAGATPEGRRFAVLEATPRGDSL